MGDSVLPEIPPEASHPDMLANPVFLICCCSPLAKIVHRLPGRRQFQLPVAVVFVPTANPYVSELVRS